MKIIARATSKALNLPRYFTGKECLRGHISERFVSTASCVECMKIHFQTWRSKNLQADREKSKEWQKANPERVREHIAKREAEIAKRIPPWSDREKIKDFYQKAVKLSRLTGIPHHVDHEIPLFGKKVSGLHVPNNLRVITAEENKKKSNSFTI